MVKLKLARVGKKKQPEYRIIVVEQGKDPWGPNNEIIGHFNPLIDKSPVTFKADRVQYWLSVGAQPTDTVHNMLIDAGLLKAEKRRKVSLSNRRRTAIGAEKAKAEEAKLAAEQKAAEAKAAAEAAAQAEKEAAQAAAESAAAPAPEIATEPETPVAPTEETPAA